jgi:hypothetical protein
MDGSLNRLDRFDLRSEERAKQFTGLQIEIGESAFWIRYNGLLELDVTWLHIY